MINRWSLYQHQPSFALGFHGTDQKVVNELVNNPSKQLKKSEDVTEWLGHGAYFWENDPERAMDWARHGKTKGSITEPDAVGAIIDLGRCLDLTTLSGLHEVQEAFAMLRDTYSAARLKLPQNKGGQDKARRELDCAVIQALHAYRQDRHEAPYDSVRAPFPEDDMLYENAGFRKRNHIQICVINTAKCIKGYFKPISML